MNSNSSVGNSEFDNFVASGYKWNQPNGKGTPITVTYSYSNLLDDGLRFDTYQKVSAIEEALSLWAKYVPINFVEVSDTGTAPSDDPYNAANYADIRFGYHNIDGNGNELAHAYQPVPTTDGRAGDVHFDVDENWRINPDRGIDFLEVAVHEIGHALGLRHEETSPAIMNPFLDNTRYNGLGTSFLYQDDINGIQSIYGQGSGSVRSIQRSNTPLTLNGETAQIAYIAYYGRPADRGGLDFWNDALTKNQVSYSPRGGDPLTGNEPVVYNQIVNQFGTSDEANRIFGSMNNRNKVNQVYQFAFDRDGEPGGLDYWTEQLDLGNVTLATVALEVALGAQNLDIAVLNNKIRSADLFSNSIDTQEEIGAYQGSTAEIFGRQWLDNFGDTFSSQAQVDAALNNLVNQNA